MLRTTASAYGGPAPGGSVGRAGRDTGWGRYDPVIVAGTRLLDRPSARAFAGRVVLAGALAAALVVGGVGVGHRMINAKLSEIPRVTDLELAAGPAQGGNYLLIGSDSRSFVRTDRQAEAFGDTSDAGGQRSDTLMVVRVDPDARRSVLVSLPRDTLVTIPGVGRERINAAFNDGPQKVIDTLKANFGIEIHHYVEVDFEAFVGIVDAIGRVPVYFPAPTRDTTTGLDIPVAPGCVPLDGTQALQYVRSRHMEIFDATRGRWVDASPRADLDRIARQQAFIRRLAAVAAERAGANPITALGVADAIVPKLKVDEGLSRRDIFRLVNTFRKVDPTDDSTLEMLTLPVIDGPGGSVVPKQPDAEAVLAPLRAPIGATPARREVIPARVRVRVLNGSGVDGLAAATSEALQDHAFAPAGIGNADATRATLLRYRPGQEDEARLVASYLTGPARLVADGTVTDADVVLVIGTDFDGVRRRGRTSPGPGSRAATPGPTGAAPAAGGNPAC